jgi:hypothetical protein
MKNPNESANKFIMRLLQYGGLLILLIFISCNNNRVDRNQTIFVKSLKTTSLIGRNICISNVFEPNSLTVQDSFLIIVDAKSEYCFHIYNTKTFKLVNEFGKRGRGPDEFINPVITSIKSENDGYRDDLIIYDRTRRRLSQINISNKISNPQYKIKSELLPKQMLNVTNIIYRNDSIALYIPYDEGNPGRFSIYNFNKESRTFTPYLPKLGFKVNPVNLYPIYATSSSCVNINKNRFVAIPALLSELDFFNLAGEYLHSSVIERCNEIKYAKNEKIIFDMPGVSYYFTNVLSVNDTIYALITGKKYPDFRNKTTSEIFVFDWDGKPIEKFLLDREIYLFSYDRNNNSFIGYSPNDQEFPFIKYEKRSK